MPPKKAKKPLGAGTSRKQSQQQAQLVANPNATTSVKLTQSQSLKIVQTSITATVSAILYIRNIFPGDYYQHRTYNLADPNFGYKVTPDDARAMENQEKDAKTVSWDMLAPGKHQHTDKVLSWLDGVGDAVQRKYLDTLVISIHHSCISPDTVVDAYVMDFSYSADGAPQVGISKGNHKLEVTGKDMSDMKTLFSRLLKMARQSGVITPNAPMIGLQLTYNNTCPEAYEPPGFSAAPAWKVIDEGRGTEVGGFSLKHHSVKVRMLPVTTTPEVPEESLPINVDHSEETILSQLQVEAQSPGVRGEIVSMMVSENTVADTQLVGMPSRGMDKAPSPIPHTPQFIMSRNAPLLETTERIFVVVESGDDGAKAFNALRSSDSIVPVLRVPGSSDCICERQLDSDAMKCERCEKHQHRICYGYLETDVLLCKFVCYDCLLKTKPGFLKEMIQMCQVRAMMWIIANEGYPRTESELAKRTGYLVKEARAASRQLLEEEYLVKVHRPHEKKSKAIRKDPLPPPFQFNESKRAQLLEDYWNPAYLFGTCLKRIDINEISNLRRDQQSSRNPTSPASVFSSMSPHPSSSKQVNQVTQVNSARPQSKPLAAKNTAPRSTSPSESTSYDDDDLDAAGSKGRAFDTMSLDDVGQGPRGNSKRPDILDLDDDDDDDDNGEDDEEDDGPIRQKNMQVASSSKAGAESPTGNYGAPATLKKRKLGLSIDEKVPAKRRTFVKSPFHVRH